MHERTHTIGPGPFGTRGNGRKYNSHSFGLHTTGDFETVRPEVNAISKSSSEATPNDLKHTETT